jgi:hypothetical protein
VRHRTKVLCHWCQFVAVFLQCTDTSGAEL